jgi:hypothetical protein
MVGAVRDYLLKGYECCCSEKGSRYKGAMWCSISSRVTIVVRLVITGSNEMPLSNIILNRGPLATRPMLLRMQPSLERYTLFAIHERAR